MVMTISRASAIGASAALLGLVACVGAGAGCASRHEERRIVQVLQDPTGRWKAVVDEVEYANGLLTSVADRVLVGEAQADDSRGTVVFSEDAAPASEKPQVSWMDGRLVIAVSRNATDLHQVARAGGVEIDVRVR